MTLQLPIFVFLVSMGALMLIRRAWKAAETSASTTTVTVNSGSAPLYVKASHPYGLPPLRPIPPPPPPKGSRSGATKGAARKKVNLKKVPFKELEREYLKRLMEEYKE